MIADKLYIEFSVFLIILYNYQETNRIYILYIYLYVRDDIFYYIHYVFVFSLDFYDISDNILMPVPYVLDNIFYNILSVLVFVRDPGNISLTVPLFVSYDL